MTQAWQEPLPASEIPVILICHNLLSDLARLVTWLETAGHQRIVLLDNASTYPPLLAYLAATPHEVVRLTENLGHVAPWQSGLAGRIGQHRPFAVSDPDVLPEPGCPLDAVLHFQRLLLDYPAFDKAGFGLRIDDLPDHFPHRELVRSWEAPYWQQQLAPGVFAAHIDTTFAVCRPGTGYKVTEAIRTGHPHLARHLPWYRDPRRPDAETAYYFAKRRADVGYWNHAHLPARVRGQRS